MIPSAETILSSMEHLRKDQSCASCLKFGIMEYRKPVDKADVFSSQSGSVFNRETGGFIMRDRVIFICGL